MAAPSKPHPVDRHVGRNVRNLRWARGITQAQLAQALGVSFQQVQKYETGANRISASVLLAIAHRLRAPVSAFFEGLPEPGADPATLTSDADATLQNPETAELIVHFRTLGPLMRRRVLNWVQSLADGSGAA